LAAPHILICGAGIGGLTAAIALAQNGATVEVFEQAAELSEVGAGLQQGPNAMQVHAALGIDKAIESAAFEPERVEFRESRSGRSLLSSPLKAVHARRYGQKYLHIHRADLHGILVTTAKKLGVIIHLGKTVEKFTQSSNDATVTVQGETYAGQVLIGADGIKSVIRGQMFGASPPKFTGHVAWRGLVPKNKLPKDLMPPSITNWLGAEKHFVSYYVKGGDYVNFVAVQERKHWEAEDWNIKGNMTELRQAFAGWDSPVTQLLKKCETCYLWGLFDHTPLSHWTDGRVALLGDAAHPMLPFMAQGASMAVEDSWVLAQSILNTPDDMEAALKTYEQARHARTTMMQKISRDNAELYHLKSPLAKIYRNMKFKIATHVPMAVHSQLDKVFGVNVVKGFPKI